MNARTLLTSFVAVGSLMGVIAGCGGAGPAPTHVVQIDVGGQVTWYADSSYYLAGVTVTLTDIDGDTWTATTNSQGLWTISNMKPGAYTEMYELAGYETVTGTFLLEAGGENDVKNIFLSRGTVEMTETRLRATVAPFGVVLRDGDELMDGFNGVSATYTGGDVVVTFNRRIYNPGTFDAYFYDDPSSGFASGVADSASEMIFTISAADIAAIDGAAGPFTDTDPYTWTAEIILDVQSFTPIHGDIETFEATLYMNVTP